MGIIKKSNMFFTSAVGNRESYDFYYDRIKELKISMFEWENMPKEIDVRYLELMLFERGGVIFFRDDELGQYLCLPFTPGGKWSVYRIPIFRRAFASNGYNRKLKINNSVIIYNNALRTNSVRETILFAKRLSTFDRIIDVNVNAQKTPLIIRCDEKERLTLENLYMKYDGNQPIIFGDRNLSQQPIECIQTQAPFIADKIYTLKTEYWNEMLTFNGISNLNIQKKERLITDEVARSQGGTMASRYSGLNARLRGCELINDMFGLNINCKYRDGIDDLEDPEEDDEYDEVENNE